MISEQEEVVGRGGGALAVPGLPSTANVGVEEGQRLSIPWDSGTPDTKPKQHRPGPDQGGPLGLMQDPHSDQALAPPSEKPRVHRSPCSRSRSGFDWS
jgi:hypothetical protein